MDLTTFIALYNILPKKYIKETFSKIFISSKFLVNIFGNFDLFKEDQQIIGNDLWKIINISHFNIDKEILSNYYIECKVGYFKFIINWCKYFIGYWSKRKDLNTITGLYVAFLKTNRNVFRIKFYVDINAYIENMENYDNQIKELFITNKIDRIYIKLRNK
ncbi:MAG: hypothetical protein SOY54_00950 [Bacilli bacterium]|nr:hypothetical protein [Bacilli bacterium]